MLSPFGFPMAGIGRIELGVRAASTANVADLTACSTTMDGVTLVQGNLVLLKDQTSSEENGVYKVGLVSGSTAPLTRQDQVDNAMAAGGGVSVFVAEGTLGADVEYKLTSNAPIVIGTTSLAFAAQANQSALTSLETRLSADESTGALSYAAEYTSLTTRVSTEESTRAANVTSIDTRVSTESSTRVANVTSIDTRVSTEVSTRASAVTSVDTAFSTADSTEVSTRASAVTSIDTRISSLIASIDA